MRVKSNAPSKTGPLIAIVVTIAALYFGKDVLIPFALALLLSFVLAAPVAWLERIRLPRALAVLLVLSCAFAIASSSLYVGVTQLSDILSQLPRYQENIKRKLEAMRNPAAFGLSKAVGSLGEIKKVFAPESSVTQITPPQPGTPAPKRSSRHIAPAPQSGPVTVEVVPPPPTVIDSLNVIGMPVIHFLVSLAGVAILTLFILLRHSDLRNRLFRLLGQDHLNIMTTAVDDAASRVGKYLLMQSLVNGTFGLLLGVGLYWVGVPNAAFWGVFGALLRFVPYFGTLVAGLCPLLLALAIFEGWAKPLMTAGLFVSIEMALSAAVEPLLFGSHTGLSSLAFLLAAAFWTLLWGPIGLVLSTPMTVCLLVIGRHVPSLQFLTVLLGDQPVLSPDAVFYQRLLAQDDDEARDVAETFLKETTLCDLYESVFVPALALAEQDRHQNALDEDREKFIVQSTRELIEEFGELALSKVSPPEIAFAPSMVIVPARDEADELVGMMLAHLMRCAGYQPATISIDAVDRMLKLVTGAEPDIVFVSALPPFAISHARSLCRRIRQVRPGLKIVLGLWDNVATLEQLRQRLGPECAVDIITTLSQAHFQVRLVADAKAVVHAPAFETAT